MCIRDRHFTLHFEWSRNSERDYPRSAGRNGLMNGSKVTGSERRGNLLCLLCVSHTDAIKQKLTEKMREQSISMTKFQKCLKQYLSMEEWFHGNNLKEEVMNSCPMISDTIKLIQSVFPRDSGHSRWLGHFNSGANIQRPYCDCKCSIDDMDNLNPNCIYLKRDDYHQHIVI